MTFFASSEANGIGSISLPDRFAGITKVAKRDSQESIRKSVPDRMTVQLRDKQSFQDPFRSFPAPDVRFLIHCQRESWPIEAALLYLSGHPAGHPACIKLASQHTHSRPADSAVLAFWEWARTTQLY